MGNFRRLYTRLFVLAAAVMIVFLSLNRNVYAAAPEITSPKATDNIAVGDTVTVKVSLGRVTDTRYVHCKITKDGKKYYTLLRRPQQRLLPHHKYSRSSLPKQKDSI